MYKYRHTTFLGRLIFIFRMLFLYIGIYAFLYLVKLFIWLFTSGDIPQDKHFRMKNFIFYSISPMNPAQSFSTRLYILVSWLFCAYGILPLIILLCLPTWLRNGKTCAMALIFTHWYRARYFESAEHPLITFQ